MTPADRWQHLVAPAAGAILTYDRSDRRLTMLDGAGSVLRTFTLEPTDSLAAPLPIHAFVDGTLLVSGEPPLEVASAPPEGRVRFHENYAEYDAGGRFTRTLRSRIPGSEVLRATRNGRMLSVPAPFPRRTIVAPQDKLIVLGTNEGPFVDFLRRGDGTWTRIEWRQSARPVERGHLELFVEALVGSAGGGREQLRQILSTALLPKELPWYDAIVVAQDSSIWIREYALPGEDSSLWRVLEPTGHLNATAMLPSSFVPTRIGADGLLGIATDSLNVERVMRFRLIDP